MQTPLIVIRSELARLRTAFDTIDLLDTSCSSIICTLAI